MTMPADRNPAMAPDRADAAGPRVVAGPVVAAFALFGVLVVSWAVYRPDVQRPFDFVDFPETLLILEAHDSFSGQVGALTASYLTHARFNLLVYVMIAVKWLLFHWWTPGWQLARFVTMGAVVVLAYAVLRRLRMSMLGALAGASVFVVAPAAVRGWIRLTSAEPVVTMFVLLAAFLATHYQTSRRKAAIGVALALIAVAVVMTKEILIVAYVLPLYLLLTMQPTGMLGAPRVDRTNAAVLIVVAGALLVAILPSVWAYVNAPATSYGRWFGTARPGLIDLLAMTVTGVVPFDLGAARSGASQLAMALYFGLLLAGWSVGTGAGLRGAEPRSQGARLAALALALPALGAMAYMPWPTYQLVYAVPFLFGAAALVAFAVSSLERAGKTAGVLAALAWGCVFAFTLGDARNEARRVEAVQFSTGRVLPRVAALHGVDSVLVAAPRNVLDQRGIFGPRLFMYAQALGQPWPPTRDVSCEDARRSAASQLRTVVVWSTLMCGAGPVPSETIRVVYRRLDWGRFRMVDDSMRFDLLRAAASP